MNATLFHTISIGGQDSTEAGYWLTVFSIQLTDITVTSARLMSARHGAVSAAKRNMILPFLRSVMETAVVVRVQTCWSVSNACRIILECRGSRWGESKNFTIRSQRIDSRFG